MKKMTILALTLVVNGFAHASPPIVDNVTKDIPGTQAKYGVTRMRMVMPGVLYRGGTTGGKQGVTLSAASAQALCNDGFDAAAYVYTQNWTGGAAQTISCKGNQLTYVSKSWDKPAAVKDVLKELYNIINEGKGAMYVHCWYGVHASGYVVTAALMQFCGLSAEEGVAYWNSNVPAKIQYPKVQQMIRNFKPYPELKISAEQQQRVCPKGL